MQRTVRGSGSQGSVRASRAGLAAARSWLVLAAGHPGHRWASWGTVKATRWLTVRPPGGWPGSRAGNRSVAAGQRVEGGGSPAGCAVDHVMQAFSGQGVGGSISGVVERLERCGDHRGQRGLAVWSSVWICARTARTCGSLACHLVRRTSPSVRLGKPGVSGRRRAGGGGIGVCGREGGGRGRGAGAEGPGVLAEHRLPGGSARSRSR